MEQELKTQEKELTDEINSLAKKVGVTVGLPVTSQLKCRSVPKVKISGKAV